NPSGIVPNLGGVLQAIADSEAFTELSCQQLEIGYMRMFDVSPTAGQEQLAFYTADNGDKTWSPLSFFIPFSPFVFLLIIASISIVQTLKLISDHSKLANSIILWMSSYCNAIGFALLFFAYNAGYQGTTIAAKPISKISYEGILQQFRSGEKLWYFRSVGVFD
ncbi:hypothetical protein PFISCL1PPCAC_14536, partial [Pristionchus fissidentatus]